MNIYRYLPILAKPGFARLVVFYWLVLCTMHGITLIWNIYSTTSAFFSCRNVTAGIRDETKRSEKVWFVSVWFGLLFIKVTWYIAQIVCIHGNQESDTQPFKAYQSLT